MPAFSTTVSVIENGQVPLAALWVYDHGGQDEWSVSATNARAYQLEALAEANERIRAAMKGGNR
jgi:hypothetical protein